jgi:zinc protease
MIGRSAKFNPGCFLLVASLFGLMGPPLSLAAEAPKKVATVEGISEYDFDNGLRLLLFPDNSQSKVSVNLTALVGSRQEGYGETGMAHLLEHMLFKGTATHTNIPKALNEHGAQFNGSTSSDRVNYFETLAATDENLEFAIALEGDRLVNSLIRKADLDSEMTVVRNEFERGENSPQDVLGKRVAAAAYDWHNYGKPTIGNRTDIERVPVENLRAFYRKFYQPDNIILIIAGKFAETNALALVQKYFGCIPRPTRKLDATWTEEPPQDGERLVMLRRVGDVSAISVAYHIPAGPHEDTASLEVLANILSTRPAGRLYKALVETKKAASASAFAERAHDPGLFSVDAEVPAGSSLDEVQSILLSVVEGAAANGVTAEEVNRAKQQILKQREMAANDTAQIGVALSEWAAQGDWRLYFLHRDRIEQVTPEKVQAVAAKYLQRNNRTVGLFIPTDKAERVAVPPAADVAAMVADYKGRAALAEGEAFDATPENVESRVKRLDLPEGIKVTLLPKKSRGEEVHLTLTLHYGDEQSLNGLEPAAGFLGELMLRGTQKLTYQQIRDELDRLTATVNAGAGGGGRRGGREFFGASQTRNVAGGAGNFAPSFA